jgi:hypothetical protein
MLVDDEFRKHVDGLLRDTLFSLPFAPRRADVWPGAESSEAAPMQVALTGWRRWGAEGALGVPTVRHQIDGAIDRVTGGTLSPDDIHTFEHRAIDAANNGDYDKLQSIQAGPPYDVTPDQKRAADGIMGRIGSDAAADRMRKAYEEAIRAGRIRVR